MTESSTRTSLLKSAAAGNNSPSRLDVPGWHGTRVPTNRQGDLRVETIVEKADTRVRPREPFPLAECRGDCAPGADAAYVGRPRLSFGDQARPMLHARAGEPAVCAAYGKRLRPQEKPLRGWPGRTRKDPLVSGFRNTMRTRRGAWPGNRLRRRSTRFAGKDQPQRRKERKEKNSPETTVEHR